MAIFFCRQQNIHVSKVSDFNRILIFSDDFLMKVPSAKFHGIPFGKGGPYAGARMDGLTGHDEANGLLSRLSERT